VSDESAELTPEQLSELYGVPQGRPGGVRLGGSAERVTVPCQTCNGAGHYPIDTFAKPDANGYRAVVVIEKTCTVCYGTGSTVELREGE
jgi:hypothetical protein